MSWPASNRHVPSTLELPLHMHNWKAPEPLLRGTQVNHESTCSYRHLKWNQTTNTLGQCALVHQPTHIRNVQQASRGGCQTLRTPAQIKRRWNSKRTLDQSNLHSSITGPGVVQGTNRKHYQMFTQDISHGCTDYIRSCSILCIDCKWQNSIFMII